VEDVLTSGLSAKLMRYLRLRVLGETSGSQKDSSHLSENKHSSGNTSVRGRDDSQVM
jgi:DDB1- and CUL4-associated factor 1